MAGFWASGEIHFLSIPLNMNIFTDESIFDFSDAQAMTKQLINRCMGVFLEFAQERKPLWLASLLTTGL